MTKEDKKHMIYFDEITDIIINSIPKQNRKFVRQQLNKLDDNFFIMLAIGVKNIIETDFVMELK